MRCAVNRFSTSVVREIRTLRSVGAGSCLRAPGDPVAVGTATCQSSLPRPSDLRCSHTPSSTPGIPTEACLNTHIELAPLAAHGSGRFPLGLKEKPPPSPYPPFNVIEVKFSQPVPVRTMPPPKPL
jgi:hypothetical protein